MKKSAVLFLLPAIVIAIMVSLYAIGHYRWLLALAISQCLSGVLSNYLIWCDGGRNLHLLGRAGRPGFEGLRSRDPLFRGSSTGT